MRLPEERRYVTVEAVLEVAPVLQRPYLFADPVNLLQEQVLLLGQVQMELRDVGEVLRQARTTFPSSPSP